MKKATPPPTSSPGSVAATEALEELLELLTADVECPGAVDGVSGVGRALLAAALHARRDGPLLVVCADNREAESLASDLQVFSPAPTEPLIVPAPDADPYRGLSPHPEVASQRAVALWRLRQGFDGIIIAPLASLLTRLISPASFSSLCVELETGTFTPRDHLIRTLRSMGYVREDPVTDYGEFSYRGGIVDVYSPSRSLPTRIEFFGDEIESLREFDPSSQLTSQLIPDCQLVPMRELVVTPEEIARWHSEAPEYWSDVAFADDLEEKLQFTGNGELFNGFEHLLPLVLEHGFSLLDYLPDEVCPTVLLGEPEQLRDRLDDIYRRLEAGYEDSRLEGLLALTPGDLYFGARWFHELARGDNVVETLLLETDDRNVARLELRPQKRYQGRLQDLLSDLSRWRADEKRLVLVMATLGRAERAIDVLAEYGVATRLADSFAEALQAPVAAVVGQLSEGFSSPLLDLEVVTQTELFGESTQPRRRSRGPVRASSFLSDFRELRPGDFVVHVDHGIGLFEGLDNVGVGEEQKEFVVLVYQGGSKLFVPVDRLDLIQKYSGGDKAPRLDRLGGGSWQKTKKRIRRSMRDLAEELLKLYARREATPGFAFPPDDALMREFEDAFEYQETPDQMAAIRDVKKDMEAARPMDRLVCGDVGYGKTEVAMRAAFKAVLGGRQVLLLAPTTVLALQHFNTFQDRFRGFPVVIEMLSRFRSRAEQKDIAQRLETGQLDILIGTHRLLSKDIVTPGLGLLVVDEEQRFGVGQKERLKSLKTQVDVLTLSATPIPRTLNMSLIGIRDLSLIETPPRDRLAVQTVLVKFSEHLVRSAIDLELKREGQVFFLHNSVDTIYTMANQIQAICPEARVGVGHGQMGEAQLEEVMLDFLNYKYDVLVCTTIIENGLDIPRANTLLVNRADRFGLSQLYQLRGRVGRSSRRAYAYLLVPRDDTLTSDARKRLAAIREFSELGSGFRIAALDLEIRGAGNLLGGEQHGHITAVGFELYVKLLEEAVAEQRGEGSEESLSTTIDLKLDIQVPAHYVDDPHQRMWLYKRVSMLDKPEALDALAGELVDRYGQYPRSVGHLLEYARLRLRGGELRLLAVERRKNRVLMSFREDTPVAAEHVLRLAEARPDLFFTPDGGLGIDVEGQVPAQMFAHIHETLDELTGP